MSIIIRPATRNDARVIYDLVHQLADFLGHGEDMKGDVADFIQYGFGEQAYYKALIAEQNGLPVGLCTYYMTFSSWRGCPGVCILDLYVAPSVRGTGLGRQLMAQTAIAGREVGATYLNLSVHHTNETGQDFYNRMGMGSVEDEQAYLIEGEQLNAFINETKTKGIVI